MKNITINMKQAWAQYRYRALVRKSTYQHELEALPPTLYEHWRKVAPFEFNGIPTDAIFFARAAEGLMRFFDCVRYSQHPCALPSKAADSVWHAWLTLPAQSGQQSEHHIDAFCQRYFGRVIPHIEASQMPVDTGLGLAATLVIARKRGGRDPASPSLPALFELDRKLGMPNGYGYQLQKHQIHLHRMSQNGRLVGSPQIMHPLDPSSLLAFGLISQTSYAAYELERQRTEKEASNGSSCGSSCGSSASDSGCDGGSSCGSSCGGGCGGGCGS